MRLTNKVIRTLRFVCMKEGFLRLILERGSLIIICIIYIRQLYIPAMRLITCIITSQHYSNLQTCSHVHLENKDCFIKKTQLFSVIKVSFWSVYKILAKFKRRGCFGPYMERNVHVYIKRMTYSVEYGTLSIEYETCRILVFL